MLKMEQYIDIKGVRTGRFTSSKENKAGVAQSPVNWTGEIGVSGFMPTFSIYDLMGITPESEVAAREKALAFWEGKYRATNKGSQKKRIKRMVDFKQHMLNKAKEDMENYYKSKEQANEDRNS
ncbi:hypothetical protein SHANETTE_189 [Bacillus phage Shanette]|uniref:Uncharacterized protein n=1 Tax=Bacillus phage Shanette TaxID=1296656 RepID=S5MN14_9CAUD|nr:hypothetical protein AVV46_gp108 [Bacillus phage Shanette]AGR47135.1 hypothetical protein SHANETTE_189 [Bacillus phage Shanette]